MSSAAGSHAEAPCSALEEQHATYVTTARGTGVMHRLLNASYPEYLLPWGSGCLDVPARSTRRFRSRERIAPLPCLEYHPATCITKTERSNALIVAERNRKEFYYEA